MFHRAFGLEEEGDGRPALFQIAETAPHLVSCGSPTDTGVTASSHQELVQALAGDKSNISHSLRTLEARGLLVIGRSAGGHAQYVRLTTEGQKWALNFTGSCE